jgi:hypothetical protein
MYADEISKIKFKLRNFENTIELIIDRVKKISRARVIRDFE